MTEQSAGGADAVRLPSAPVILAWLAFGLSVMAIIVAVMLPPRALSWLRSDFHFLGNSLNWLEGLTPNFDLTHAVLFGWLAFLLAFLLQRRSLWSVALPLVCLSVATELLQFLVPGRHPLVSDCFDDLVGIAFGMGLARLLLTLVRVSRLA